MAHITASSTFVAAPAAAAARSPAQQKQTAFAPIRAAFGTPAVPTASGEKHSPLFPPLHNRQPYTLANKCTPLYINSQAQRRRTLSRSARQLSAAAPHAPM